MTSSVTRLWPASVADAKILVNSGNHAVTIQIAMSFNTSHIAFVVQASKEIPNRAVLVSREVSFFSDKA